MGGTSGLDKAYRYGSEWLFITDCMTLYKVSNNDEGTPKFIVALKIHINKSKLDWELQYILEVPDEIIACIKKLLTYKGALCGGYNKIQKEIN